MCVCVCVCEEKWFEEAVRSRAGWRVLYRDGVDSYRERQIVNAPTAVVRDVVCEVCSRNFRRESDKARHKCVNERRKPISEQQGATQCLQCTRWFRSKGGLAVHRCVPQS